VVKIKDFEHFFSISFFWHVLITKEYLFLASLSVSSVDLFEDKEWKKISLNFLNKSKRDTLSEWMNENVK